MSGGPLYDVEEQRLCEVPDCGRPAWGSEAVCRPHLLTGVTAAKVAARRAMQETAAAVLGGDADSARQADLFALATSLGVDVKKSWKADRIAAAIDAARTKTDDPVADIASADPTAVDPELIQAAQITGVPGSDAATDQKEVTNHG